ncbi:MAG: molybdopterin dinucleotide binding domain-containing protein, partial [Mariprofundales bacterium]|nr:molybdopterin dinucleotide binding domain-containing protein [Mariprofundales bacterium]
QGVNLNIGKHSEAYRNITTTLEMNAEDMERLGLRDGDLVRLRTAVGEAVVRCKKRKPADLPSGVLFLPYGPASSQLMDGDTAGTGMPLSKSFEVEVEPVVR